MRVARVIVASTAIAACTTFGDAPGSTSTIDAGGGDALAEAATQDGGEADGGRGADAGPSFCTTVTPKPLACADFEDGIFPPSSLTIHAADGGSAQLVPNCGMSPSTSCVELAGTRPNGGPNGAFGAALRFAIGGAPRNVSVATAVRLGEITGGRADILGIMMSSAPAGTVWVVELEVEKDGTAHLVEHEFSTAGNLESSVAVTRKLPVQSWARAELGVEVAGGTSTAFVKIDGVDAASKTVEAHSYETLDFVEVGDRQLDVGVGMRMRVDDIVVRTP